MKNRIRLGFVFAAVGLLLGSGAPAPAQSTEAISLGLRGVYFVENQGQWSDAGVYYGFKTRGLDIAFRESSFTMHLAREVDSTSRACKEAGLDRPRAATLVSPDVAPEADSSDDPVPTHEHLTLTVTFPGSNDVLPEAAEPQSAKFNYYIGDDESKWASNVPSFGDVVYRNLYDGVDLHISGAPDGSGVLKYEFHVQPGADWSQIRINYDGVDSLCIDDAGDLRINTTFGTLTDAAPLVWQEGSSDLSDPIPARFELDDNTTYHITLDGPVDPTRELVIDPVVEWMLYVGGSGNDVAQANAIGPAGNLLTVGETGSVDFEGQNNSYHGGATDAFVASITRTGALSWMTYFGGSDEERGLKLDLDGSGALSICGTTLSSDLPGRRNIIHGLEDGFVAGFDRGGNLRWTTYLGGSGEDVCNDIAINDAGHLLVTGSTESIDFEGRNNSTHDNHWHYGDVFVAELNGAGALQWMTYYGGELGDQGSSISIGRSGDVFVTGSTASLSFEGQLNSNLGFTDAFALRLTGTGDTMWMRYFGGAEDEGGLGMVLDDENECMYLVGGTASQTFDGQINRQHGGDTWSDGFLLKVNTSGDLAWMIFLGGTEGELAHGAAIDGNGQIIVAGETASTNFEGRINEHHGAYSDAFVLSVGPSGDLGWMMYLGGIGSEAALHCIADHFGHLYLCGTTRSLNFEGARNSNHGGRDAFVLRVSTTEGPQLSAATSCPEGGPIRIEWHNATPSAPAALLFARSTGAFTIPNNRPCPGTTLGLGAQQLRIAFTGNSDADGSRTLNANAGPGACGGYLQLLDLSTCATSNVARIE